jgi:hypothetical protein
MVSTLHMVWSADAMQPYAAVVKPVEGTILTVISDAAAAAVEAAGQRPDLESTLTAAVTAARDAVDRTPTLLPVLREAGVVDAGGQGLYLVLEGGLLHILGRSAAVGRPVAESAADGAPGRPRRTWRRRLRLRDDVPAPGHGHAAGPGCDPGLTSSPSAARCSWRGTRGP